MGNAARIFYKRLASLIVDKSNSPYSITLAWLMTRLSFSLLRSAIQCIRRTRSSRGRPGRGKLKVWKSHAQPLLSSVRRHVFQILMLSIACLQGLIIWRCHRVEDSNIEIRSLAMISPKAISGYVQSCCIFTNCRHTWENFSSAVKDCKTGSMQTSWQTSERTFAVKSHDLIMSQNGEASFRARKFMFNRERSTMHMHSERGCL